MEAFSFTTIINWWGKINGKREFCTKASLRMSGNDVKGTNGWKTPLEGERGPASDILGKFCTNPDGGMVFCKR